MNEEFLKTFCLTLFKHPKIKEVYFLEGGAALKLFYQITTLFSGDLDFTFNNPSAERDLSSAVADTCNKIENKPVKITETQNKLTVFTTRGCIDIDFYFANGENCEYTRELPNLTEPVYLHSLQDLLAEKICCIYSREKEKDVLDAISIVEYGKINTDIFMDLLRKKFLVKFNLKWDPVYLTNIAKNKYSHPMAKQLMQKLVPFIHDL